jgi:hypothetical protein
MNLDTENVELPTLVGSTLNAMGKYAEAEDTLKQAMKLPAYVSASKQQKGPVLVELAAALALQQKNTAYAKARSAVADIDGSLVTQVDQNIQQYRGSDSQRDIDSSTPAASVLDNAAAEIPLIIWGYRSASKGFPYIQCVANGIEIGEVLSCKNYDTCGNLDGNRLACAGTYYLHAILRARPTHDAAGGLTHR